MAVRGHGPAGCRDDAADDVDQRALARAVRAEQREDLAGDDVEVDVAERLEAGSVWVNQHPSMDPNVPFGGIKSSGLGVEGGLRGLEEFTCLQIVNVKK